MNLFGSDRRSEYSAAVVEGSSSSASELSSLHVTSSSHSVVKGTTTTMPAPRIMHPQSPRRETPVVSSSSSSSQQPPASSVVYNLSNCTLHTISVHPRMKKGEKSINTCCSSSSLSFFSFQIDCFHHLYNGFKLSCRNICVSVAKNKDTANIWQLL